jgi:hypothetical protein
MNRRNFLGSLIGTLATPLLPKWGKEKEPEAPIPERALKILHRKVHEKSYDLELLSGRKIQVVEYTCIWEPPEPHLPYAWCIISEDGSKYNRFTRPEKQHFRMCLVRFPITALVLEGRPNPIAHKQFMVSPGYTVPAGFTTRHLPDGYVFGPRSHDTSIPEDRYDEVFARRRCHEQLIGYWSNVDPEWVSENVTRPISEDMAIAENEAKTKG